MNSEELEQSLRTEFENYLKNTIAEMKQEVSDFQEKIASEFEQHKNRIDESVKDFSEKFNNTKELEGSFRDSVSEHLKLAREEGSKITASAFEEAEKLREEEAKELQIAEPVLEFTEIRDAINDISSKDSQSEILKSLVHHATQFTPRGAFFIVKNEHLVGWRMFGTEEHPNPQVVREVFFPISSKTALSESIETLATVEGSSEANEDNLLYLTKLDFEEAENLYALPLVARGRGVAVLYADNGSEGGKVNVEALETLMRVAGLTVEVLASTQTSKTQPVTESTNVDSSEQETPKPIESEEPQESYSQELSSETDIETVAETDSSYSFDNQNEVEDVKAEDTVKPLSDYTFQPNETEEAPVEEVSFEAETPLQEEVEESFTYQDTSPSPVVEKDFNSTEIVTDDTTEILEKEDYSVTFDSGISDNEETTATEEDYSVSFDSADSAESLSFESNTADTNPIAEDYQTTSEFETRQFETFAETPTTNIAEQTEYQFESNDAPVESNDAPVESVSDESLQSETFTQEVETPVEEKVATPSVRTRFGDRNVDLPIEVAEDERRLHNDARRFARLLVSEIKLYNEQKVKEGRDSSDLYERLREAIDRSREMYDKRVQPPVAAKFDYFNYELINTLAEGEETKLGSGYPGATV